MKVLLIGVAIIVFAVTFVKAYEHSAAEQAKFAQERDNHVIQTWENAPKDFHGHNCQYGDWCTRNYYEHLKKHQ